MPTLRSLLATDDDWRYGSVLPLAQNKKTGEMSPAIPGMVREPIRGLLGLFDEFQSAVEGKGFDPQAVTEGALAMPIGGLLGAAPKGALRSNMLKLQLNRPKLNKAMRELQMARLSALSKGMPFDEAISKYPVPNKEDFMEMLPVKTKAPKPGIPENMSPNDYRINKKRESQLYNQLSKNFHESPEKTQLMETVAAGGDDADAAGLELSNISNQMQIEATRGAIEPFYNPKKKPDITPERMKSLLDKSTDPQLKNLLDIMVEKDPERIQRAKDMGFDTSRIWLHGTQGASDLSEFQRGSHVTPTVSDLDTQLAHFFTNKIKSANSYVDPNVSDLRNMNETDTALVPVFLRHGEKGPEFQNKALRVDFDDRDAESLYYEDLLKAIHQGYTTSIRKDAREPTGYQAAVTDPNNIRSIFAQFKNEGPDLLSANTNPIPSLTGLLGDQNEPLPRLDRRDERSGRSTTRR